MRRLLCLAVIGCLVLALGAYAQQDGSRGGDTPARGRPAAATATPQETIVYVVRSVPPDQVARALLNLFGDERDLRVTPNSPGNAVLIRCPAALREKIVATLEQVDPPMRVLTVQLMVVRRTADKAESIDAADFAGPAERVAAAIRRMEQQGAIQVTDRIVLTMLENNPATTQVGQSKPRVTAEQQVGPGRRVRSFDEIKVGTLLDATGRVLEDNRIALQLQFEKSDLIEPAEEAEEDGVFTPPSILTFTQKVTVEIRDGEMLLVSGAASSSSDAGDMFLVVGAQIQKSGQRSPSGTLGFSNRPRSGEARPSGGGLSRRPGSGQRSPRFEDMAAALMRRYDSNSDRALEPEEWKEVRGAGALAAADDDGDGTVTLKELTEWIKARYSSQRPSPPRRPEGGA